MTPGRIAFWMLATAGVAVGHVVGYSLAHPDDAAREVALGGHAYLPTVASAVVPLGLMAAVVWAVRTARSLGLAGRLRWEQLALAQVAVFVVQELAERVVSGDGAASAVTERGVWFGLLAQVLVAFLVTRAVELVRRVVHRMAGAGPLVSVPLCPPTFGLRPSQPLLPLVATVAVGPRAPPVTGRRR